MQYICQPKIWKGILKQKAAQALRQMHHLTQSEATGLVSRKKESNNKQANNNMFSSSVIGFFLNWKSINIFIESWGPRFWVWTKRTSAGFHSAHLSRIIVLDHFKIELWNGALHRQKAQNMIDAIVSCSNGPVRAGQHLDQVRACHFWSWVEILSVKRHEPRSIWEAKIKDKMLDTVPESHR